MKPDDKNVEKSAEDNQKPLPYFIWRRTWTTLDGKIKPSGFYGSETPPTAIRLIRDKKTEEAPVTTPETPASVNTEANAQEKRNSQIIRAQSVPRKKSCCRML